MRFAVFRDFGGEQYGLAIDQLSRALNADVFIRLEMQAVLI